MKKRILSFLLALLMLFGMLPVNVIAEGTENYDGDIGKYAKLNEAVSTFTVADGAGNAYTYYPEDFTSDTVLQVAQWKVDGTGLWYQVTFYSGSTQGDYVADFPTNPWFLQTGDALLFVEYCDICQKPDCGVDHNQTTDPTEPDPTDPSIPDDSCECCENCTGAEGCTCQCGECDFCQPEEPELPVLTHPTGVEVTAESFPEGVTLTVQNVNVASQLNRYRIPESKQVFGLDISLLNADSSIYQPGGALVKVPVSAPVGTKIGIIHDHNGNISFMGVTKVLADGTVEFYTDSFSTFAGFTVDFHYNGVDYSIEGLSSILLSDLFIAMGIEENAYAAKSVVFSDNTLVGVAQQEDGNWLLTSLEAFSTNETLIITFNNDRTIVIDVTDANTNILGNRGSLEYTNNWATLNLDMNFNLYEASGTLVTSDSRDNIDRRSLPTLGMSESGYWYLVQATNVDGLSRGSTEHMVVIDLNTNDATVNITRYSWDIATIGNTIGINQHRCSIYRSQDIEKRRVLAIVNNDQILVDEEVVFPNVGADIALEQLDVQHIWVDKYLYYRLDSQGNKVEHSRKVTANGVLKYEDTTGTTYTYDSASKTYTIRLLTRYNVEYHANGGSGTMAKQPFVWGIQQNLNPNAFTAPTYTVSYEPNGGSACSADTVNNTFAGWATSANGGVTYANNFNVTADNPLSATPGGLVSMYAVWNPTSSVTLPNPTKTGYTFKGWYSDPNFSDASKIGNAGDTYNPKASVTLYAKWEANTYKVTLDAQNGTGDSDGTTAYWYIYNTTKNVNGETVYYWTNAACTSPLHNYTITKPTKKGHTFGGYYTAVNGGGTQYVDDKGMCVNNLYAAVADNSTLHAKWTAKTFTVNYHSNGGSGSMDSHTVVYGNTIQIKDNAFTAPSGKRFAGWAVSSTGTAGEHGWSRADKTGWSGTWSYDNGEYGIANDTLNLYAVWEDDDRTVTWKNWNGDELEKDTVTYNGTATYNGTTPTRESADGYSYSFTGWDKGTNGTVSNVTTDTTVTAQYSKTPISYTASFDYNGGDEGVATKNFTVESALTLPKLTKTGYTGKWIVTKVEGNWVNGAEFASEGSVAAGKYGNVTFTAQWTPITYKIQFAGGEGGQGSMTEITATYDKDVTLSENKFQRIIKVTYDVNGGKNLKPNDTVVNLEATFKNWISGSETYDDKASVKNLASTQDAVVQLTAQWNLKSTTTPTVERDGYTFGGWMEEGVATGTAISAGGTYTPTRDITLVAQWNPISYTITYDSNGGSAVEPTSYNIEQAVTLASAPTREGYKFNGWKLKTTGGNWEDIPYTAGQVISAGKYGNITLEAQWNDQYRYVLKFDANGGEKAPQTITVDWCDKDSNIFNWDHNLKPTRDGYTFLGWAEASTSETNVAGSSYNTYTVPGEKNKTVEKTLFAIWKRDTGDLKLTFNGGQTNPAIVTVTGGGKTITLVLTKSETVIKDLPTGTYEVTVESGNASYTASVNTNPEPEIKKDQTAVVEIEVHSKGLNWFTAFYWVKNKFGKLN